ncbi:phenylalanine--tRNA ligase subunit alpha, partial [Aerococcus urinaeequi]
MIDDLKAIENQIMDEIDAAQSLADIKAVRVKYLGKKGPITEALRGMRDLSAEERPQVGAYANELKAKASTKLTEKEELLSAAALEAQLQAEAIDVTLPGEKLVTGTKHVLTQVMEEIEDLFVSMGYEVVEGPEIESDFYNFERMNLPKDHPARDMQDTFYINDEVLLRTHTSPVQARAMDAHDFEAGPLKMISPGKVYRRD